MAAHAARLRVVPARRRPTARGKFLPAVKERVGQILIRPIADAGDQAFVVHLKRVYAERNGLPYVAWDNALYFVAKHALSNERLACMAVTKLQPLGSYFVGDFFTVDGKKGRLAALAMFEALHGSGLPVMGLVAHNNPRMRDAALRYGYREVATLMERQPGEVRT